MERKCVIVATAERPEPGCCLCPEHLLRTSKLRPAWLAGKKKAKLKGGFKKTIVVHGLHAGKRRMPALQEATLGCFFKSLQR